GAKDWIPAFAGMTTGGRAVAFGFHWPPRGTKDWIPAFAGMTTGGRAVAFGFHWPRRGAQDWIPAFAGTTTAGGIGILPVGHPDAAYAGMTGKRAA
ncbi:MAG: hypothetical protein OXR07_06850, partial [Nitrospira sp.]|nr:hypothetical protein [Nitrospira sp.]